MLFTISKKVIIEVEAICRTFLWSGSDHPSSNSHVAWDMVCLPYDKGGLNLRNFLLWNRAVVLSNYGLLIRRRIGYGYSGFTPITLKIKQYGT